MWIDKRGRQHRVYYRTENLTGDPTGPKRQYVPFASHDQAETFIELARLTHLQGALDWVRHDGSDAGLQTLLTGAFATLPTAGPPRPAEPFVRAEPPSPERGLATVATAGLTPDPPGTLDRLSPCVGATFRELWEKFIRQQRHLEDHTVDLYKSYWTYHFAEFFGDLDLGLIRRARPLRARDVIPDAVYVDDWVEEMLRKPRRSNAGKPIKGTRLSYKFIKNVHTVLAQVFDVALQERPTLLEINPAREIRLPKQDRREMFFLPDGRAYTALMEAINDHFPPLIAFLVGTGARFGEAAGLLVRNVHLDVERPYLEIRQILKWVRKKWRLGRPKTKASVRRISLSPQLVELLRPLVAGKSTDEHVFTMVEGGPLHHGNFSKRYFKPAVAGAAEAGNVPKKLRIHDLRHTHAAWLLSAGVPVFMVQRRLGHSSAATTQDVYGHFTPEADDRALATIDRLMPVVRRPEEPDDKPIRAARAEAALPEFDVDDLDDLAA